MASTNKLGTLYRAAMMAWAYRNPVTAFRNRLGMPSDGPVSYRLRAGPTLVVDPGSHDIRQLNEIWIDEVYSTFPGFTPQPGWTVIDIGANKGVFSAWAAHHMKHGTILAVEPDPQSIEFARTNTAQFPSVKIALRQSAVGATSGAVELFVSEGATGLTSVYGRKAGDGEIRVPSGRTIVAPCTTLSEILGSCHPDLVKIDVEGSEYDILLSTSLETLSSMSRVVLEHDLRHPTQANVTYLDLEQHLRNAGFTIESLSERRLMFATSPEVTELTIG